MIYAEEANYWQSSRTSPDTWMDKAKKQIEKLGGIILAEGFGSEPTTGRAAFMLHFEIEGDRFKLIWPTLPTKGSNDRAARIQAATMLYHNVKATCLKALIFGARTAFFAHLELPDGRTAANLSGPELLRSTPSMFAPQGVPQLEAGDDDVIDAEIAEPPEMKY